MQHIVLHAGIGTARSRSRLNCNIDVAGYHERLAKVKNQQTDEKHECLEEYGGSKVYMLCHSGD